MPLEDIIRKINEDARSEADSLLSVARAEAEAFLEKAKREVDALRSELMHKSEKTAEEHANRIMILDGLDQRKDVLKEKKKLIEEAFIKAEDAIKSLPPDEYRAFLKPLILSAVESGREEIIPSSAQRSVFTPEFLKSLNDELGNVNGRLCLSNESGDFVGGFILREGNKEINQTLKSLFESKRESLEPLIANLLFGKNTRDG